MNRISKILTNALQNGRTISNIQLPAFKRSRSTSFDNYFFNNASSLIRNLENEFDRLRSSMFTNVLNPTLPMTPISDKISTDIVQIDEQGNRKLNLELDLSGFDPESEIKIETKGHVLTLSAKKEKTVSRPPQNKISQKLEFFLNVFLFVHKSKNSYTLCELSHSYQLPDDLNLDDLKSKWSDGGLLTIEAPLPKALDWSQKAIKPKDQEKEIKIIHSEPITKTAKPEEQVNQMKASSNEPAAKSYTTSTQATSSKK